MDRRYGGILVSLRSPRAVAAEAYRLGIYRRLIDRRFSYRPPSYGAGSGWTAPPE